MNKKKIAIYSAIILGIYFISGFFHGKKAPHDRPPVPVIIEKVVQEDVPLYIDAVGSCRSFESVDVVPQVSGKILSVYFNQGDEVSAGSKLFLIDPRKYDAALEIAQANLDAAKAQYEIDNAKLERSRALLPQNYISKQDFEALEALVARDKAAIDSANGQLSQAKIDVENTTVLSPINGVTGQYKIDVGNVVLASSVGSQVLVRVENLDKLYVDFVVSENQFIGLKENFLESGSKLNAKIEVISDQTINCDAIVSFIDNNINKNSGIINLRACLDNKDRKFWPGQSVRVKLILKIQKDSILVPLEAVKLSQNGYYVFVIKEGNIAELRMVDVGQRYGEKLLIKSGVNVDENVVKRGQLMLAPGSKVVPTQDPHNNPYDSQVKAEKNSVSKNPTTN